MAEELYFIKTNPNIAKINLYNKLCREEENILNFLQNDTQTHLETIKEKVKDSVEELTKEELSNIFSWFHALYPSDHEEVKTQLFVHGIDLFYEIPSTEEAQHFLQILSDYEKFSQQHLDYIVNAQNFNQFLVYGIFFTEILTREQGKENILSDYLKPDYPDLYVLAENQSREQNFDGNKGLILQHDFTELYDLTKFYKGSIIQLEHQ
ncbi:hypothetical protein C1637_22920 [Chryseobacterium lactis]|uniref:Uncharacterized protein n=1 Tax=Chryseobacterium lactis TaxID=1241981 RepID=A0A3G6RUB5_CHRLC|nr:hypothetical protein [Chryseobacterium lactis]AZA80474.1 hypothetical protein EG342_00415 [Chryseobacterium lactis]AZB05476.1 hypothetical protein EG341_16540 [Chryseobacterium lactis]PNW11389.1 hypothetical protein C1637_22920 [Chryseobacterium lactis]